MSQFDFPRINFFGKTKINIATCNNDDFKPAYTANGSGIMVHDIVKAEAFAPPRIYLTAALKTLMDAAHQANPTTVPAYTFVDAGTSMGTQYYYVALESINTPEIFVAWAHLPLGQYCDDNAYNYLYNITLLTGNVPGEWNYNGGMQNAIEDCTVVSVAVKPADNSGDNLFLASDPGACPADLSSFLGASFNAVNDKNQNTAVLCDLNPAAASTTQYFVDGFYLREAGSKDTLMAGRPYKGVTRWINFGRVVNIPGSPMIASGGVFQAIPAEAMTEWATLQAAFEAHGDSSKKLIGAFVRYDLFEVYENRDPVYAELPNYGTNPAYMSVMGSITPWYEGDMATASTGRLLNPTATPNTNRPMAPVTFAVDTNSSLLSLDLFNTLQEDRDPSGDFSPSTNGKTPPPMSYTLSKVGALDVKVAGTTLATINIDGSTYTRQDMINNGGMYDWIYAAGTNADTIQSSDFSIWGPDACGDSVQLMAESRYVIQSDQSCAYANAGGPNDSFLSQGTSLSPTYLRVLDRGVPLAQANALTVTETAYGVDCTFNMLQINQASLVIHDGMEVIMDTSTENILVYVYTPPGGTLPTPSNFSGGTEFYLNLRVLPDQSAKYAGYYLQPGDPGYKKLDWTALFNEIFFTYYMLYPAMTQVSSLMDPNNWSNPGAAGALKSYTSQDNWDGYLYMPRSRDLSDADRKLIDTWADGIINGTS